MPDPDVPATVGPNGQVYQGETYIGNAHDYYYGMHVRAANVIYAFETKEERDDTVQDLGETEFCAIPRHLALFRIRSGLQLALGYLPSFVKCPVAAAAKDYIDSDEYKQSLRDWEDSCEVAWARGEFDG